MSCLIFKVMGCANDVAEQVLMKDHFIYVEFFRIRNVKIIRLCIFLKSLFRHRQHNSLFYNVRTQLKQSMRPITQVRSIQKLIN